MRNDEERKTDFGTHTVMTDQPQPDRQNGDGLLRERPLYNFDSVEFVEVKHDDWSKILQLASLATPRPARDAAEGAVDPAIAYTQDCWKRGSAPPQQVMPDLGPDWTPPNPSIDAMFATAPPKPATDTVREALESIADWCSTERAKIGAVDGYDYRSGEEFGLRRVEIEITKRALSAPVPPAEPVAYRHTILEPADKTPSVIFSGSRDNPWQQWPVAHLDGCKYTCTPLYATPPVRGDRDIIRDFEDVCEKIAATRPQAAYLAMIDGGQGDLLAELDAVRHRARAILSLPVPPGAGERE